MEKFFDAYDTADTILDPCKSGTEKLIAGGLFVAGALLPGGGYSKIDDGFKYTDKVLHQMVNVYFMAFHHW